MVVLKQSQKETTYFEGLLENKAKRKPPILGPTSKCPHVFFSLPAIYSFKSGHPAAWPPRFNRVLRTSGPTAGASGTGSEGATEPEPRNGPQTGSHGYQETRDPETFLHLNMATCKWWCPTLCWSTCVKWWQNGYIYIYMYIYIYIFKEPWEPFDVSGSWFRRACF